MKTRFGTSKNKCITFEAFLQHLDLFAAYLIGLLELLELHIFYIYITPKMRRVSLSKRQYWKFDS